MDIQTRPGTRCVNLLEKDYFVTFVAAVNIRFRFKFGLTAKNQNRLVIPVVDFSIYKPALSGRPVD